MDDFGSAALRRLLEHCTDAVRATHAQHGDATAQIAAARLIELLRFLRDDADCAFEMLTDLTVVDRLGEEPRFEVVYHLYSVAKNQRVRLKVGVPEGDPVVASATAIYASANWMEREAFDLYGIRFDGHPDLRRILLYEEFEGHPLRKDYPKTKRQPLIGPEG
jgi:NADH-quinone oxidoreductase subunit C